MTNDFINHLMLCKKCYGAGGRYCAEGKSLKIDSDAAYFAQDLANIPNRIDREKYMTRHCNKHIDLPALKIAITEKYQAIKKQERAA